MIQSKFVSGTLDHDPRPRVALVTILLLIALPPLASALDAEFYIGLANRILIFAIAATSLNLILGFGGMISFGHAAFFGVGGYTVAILLQQGASSAFIAWPLAAFTSGLLALIIGAVSLRTRGVYFIMITLALAQMLYYLVISLPSSGGDDGMTLRARPDLFAFIDIGDDRVFFYVLLAIIALVMFVFIRIINSNFGHAL